MNFDGDWGEWGWGWSGVEGVMHYGEGVELLFDWIICGFNIS